MRCSHNRKVHKGKRQFPSFWIRVGEKNLHNRTSSCDQGLGTERSLEEHSLQWDPEVAGPWAELAHSHLSGLWCLVNYLCIHDVPELLTPGWDETPFLMCRLGYRFSASSYGDISAFLGRTVDHLFLPSFNHVGSLQKRIDRRCSGLWDHPHTYCVVFRGYVNSFTRTIAVIPKAALKTLPQHIMWRGGEFGLGLGLGFASVRLLGCIQRGITATVTALPKIQLGVGFGEGV